MSNDIVPDLSSIAEDPSESPRESFGELLAQLGRAHPRQPEGAEQMEGTVVSPDAELVYLDIGFKVRGHSAAQPPSKTMPTA